MGWPIHGNQFLNPLKKRIEEQAKEIDISDMVNRTNKPEEDEPVQ